MAGDRRSGSRNKMLPDIQHAPSATSVKLPLVSRFKLPYGVCKLLTRLRCISAEKLNQRQMVMGLDWIVQIRRGQNHPLPTRLTSAQSAAVHRDCQVLDYCIGIISRSSCHERECATIEDHAFTQENYAVIRTSARNAPPVTCRDARTGLELLSECEIGPELPH